MEKKGRKTDRIWGVDSDSSSNLDCNSVVRIKAICCQRNASFAVNCAESKCSVRKSVSSAYVEGSGKRLDARP